MRTNQEHFDNGLKREIADFYSPYKRQCEI